MLSSHPVISMNHIHNSSDYIHFHTWYAFLRNLLFKLRRNKIHQQKDCETVSRSTLSKILEILYSLNSDTIFFSTEIKNSYFYHPASEKNVEFPIQVYKNVQEKTVST
jgi:hypothetical protein